VTPRDVQDLKSYLATRTAEKAAAGEPVTIEHEAEAMDAIDADDGDADDEVVS
jgi:hypothetical protein